MKKTFAIGDIHGGFRALTQLIDKLDLGADDTLIFLGDYVDGWSEPVETLDFLLQLELEYNCIFIKGNHDAWCEDWLKTGELNELWFHHGGQATFDAYSAQPANIKKYHLGFLERMLPYHVQHDCLFIHAGYTSMHGPEKENYTANYRWDRTLWEMAVCMDSRIQKDEVSFPKRLKLFKEIFIGHTPTLNYNVTVPMQACNVWNIDTGAAFTGKLSAINVDTKEVFQSDVVQSLYPNEKGRN